MKPQINATELCEINQPQMEALKANGFFVYGLRDWEGNDYGIEPNLVWVNDIGVMVTDKEIPEVNQDGVMAASDFYKTYEVHDIHDDIFDELLDLYMNTNYFFHVKGEWTEQEEVIRTYSIEKAKEILKTKMKYIKAEDPTARAYQFGYGKNKNILAKSLEISKAHSKLSLKRYESRTKGKRTNGQPRWFPFDLKKNEWSTHINHRYCPTKESCDWMIKNLTHAY